MTTAGQVFDSFISRGVDVIIEHRRPARTRHGADGECQGQEDPIRNEEQRDRGDERGRPRYAKCRRESTLPWLTRFAGSGGLVRATSEISEVSRLLKRLDLRPLKDAAHARIRTFSGGNQQKVVIARWLPCAARHIPFRRTNPRHRRRRQEQVYEVIRELGSRGPGSSSFHRRLKRSPACAAKCISCAMTRSDKRSPTSA